MEPTPTNASGHDASIGTYAFDDGAIHCIAIHDGHTTYEAGQHVVNAIVLALHFPPFLSLGHVDKRGSRWHWEPASLRI